MSVGKQRIGFVFKIKRSNQSFKDFFLSVSNTYLKLPTFRAVTYVTIHRIYLQLNYILVTDIYGCVSG